ncbi:hypothetical protein LCGC14_0774980 [marine sediment metagenome]|uniref:Uncharacterized protein n=1 Tax=marine sediment metagenome TaxID=412755 RepID=A0A0F9PXG5_9ZZZZ
MISINYDQIYNNWIKPELEKRKAEGLIENDFRFTKCLITFSKNSGTIVKFNKEAVFTVLMKVLLKESKNKGDPITIEEVNDIADVELPKENGEKIPFIYVQFNGSYSEGALYDIIFDFTPKYFLTDTEKEQSAELTRKSLVKLFRRELREKIIRYIAHFKDILVQNGFWVIPALLPSPLNKIIVTIQNNNVSEAKELFLNHCSNQFLKELLKNWWELKEFSDRREVIEEAFFCHNNGRFIPAISTLLPHLEGIITEFGHSISTNMPFRQESKTKKVRDLLSEISLATYEFQSVLYFTFSFLIDGPLLETFKDWFQKVNVNFPNRHVVGHGKFIRELYTQENSIKVFLLLDTIYWIIKEFTNVNVIEHQEMTKKLHKINILDLKGKIEEALNEVEEILNYSKFTMKYDFFRQAVYYKMVFYYELEKLEEALELFEKYGINELSETFLNPFNIKSLLLAKKGEFEEAHRIIDEVIENTQKILEKLNYTDSKGEIFQMEGKFEESIKIYEGILKRVKEDLEPKAFIYFNHITHLKLGICYNEEGNVEKALEHIKEGKRIAEKRKLEKWIKKAEELLSKIN